MKKLKDAMKDHPEASLRVAFFALFYVTSYGIFLFISFLVSIFLPSFFGFMASQSTPLLPGSKVALDIPGFLFPLIISVGFVAISYKIHSPTTDKRFRLSIVVLIIILTVVTVFCMFSGYQLKPIYSNGGGPNLPAFFIVPAFAMVWVALDIKKIGPFISYSFGFLVGFISDIEGLRYFVKDTVFGGHGFLDLDFVIPIMLSVSYILTYKYAPKYYGR